jgi:glycosyltransferase involved in cell wall biosynthesis
MPKVSVIVPVYHVEKYLAKCLDSICNQTLQDIEILVINNGSRVSDRKIIERFAARDSRIVIIDHQKNQGLGYARNSALRIATGEYVSFVDSDDWVDKGMMEAFYLEAVRTNADLVIGTFYEVSSNERSIKSILMDPAIWQHKVPFSWRENREIFYLPTPVWDKFYRRSLLEDNKIFFSREIGEDIPFKWEVFTSASRISSIPEPMYYYRVRKTSLTGGKKICVDVFRVHDIARKFLIERGLYDNLLVEFNIREISEIIYLSWKARSALVSDEITFSAYWNLAKKSFDAMDIKKLYRKFSYLSFPYIFLYLFIRSGDNPAQYRAILKTWETIAARYKQPTAKFGKFQLEQQRESILLDEAWISIESSHDFFRNLQSISFSKPHYDDAKEIKAVEIAHGCIVIIPPLTEQSGDPARVSAQMTKPLGADALSFIVWTMQPERGKTLNIVASIGRQGLSESLITVVKTMDPSTWYDLITFDCTAFGANDMLELTLQVEGVGPFPFYCTAVRLSNFQFH